MDSRLPVTSLDSVCRSTQNLTRAAIFRCDLTPSLKTACLPSSYQLAIRLIIFIVFLLPSPSIAPYINPDVSTLVNVKLQLIDPNCALDTWDASRPICSWQGVQWIVSNSVLLDCSDPISIDNISMNTDSSIGVYSLHLEEAGLAGPLPRNLASLTTLYELNMTGNKFSGSIPCELGNIPYLNLLDLSRNSLSGELCLDTDVFNPGFFVCCKRCQCRLSSSFPRAEHKAQPTFRLDPVAARKIYVSARARFELQQAVWIHSFKFDAAYKPAKTESSLQ